MKSRLSRQPIRRLPALPGLVVMLALVLTASGSPLAAQQAPLNADPSSAGDNDPILDQKSASSITVPAGFNVTLVASGLSPIAVGGSIYFNSLQDLEFGRGAFGDYLYFIDKGVVYRVPAPGDTPQPFASVPQALAMRFGFDGDLFVSTAAGKVIRVRPNGTTSLFAQVGSSIEGMAFDTSSAYGSHLYVSEWIDGGYGRVSRITSNGSVSIFTPQGSVGYETTGLEFCGSPVRLYVADQSGTIFEVTNNGSASLLGGVDLDSKIQQGEVLACSRSQTNFGNYLYVAEQGYRPAGRILRVSLNGTVEVFASGFQGFDWWGVTGLKFGPDGKALYVTDDAGRSIYAIHDVLIPTYTISGRVTEAGGFTGIGGVAVWADSTRSTTTNANGDYTLTGLPAGTYSVRPSLTPYAFSPASRLVSVPTNQTGVNFRKVVITKVQVNQVLGNTTNYVAGKDTAVRVFLSGAVPFDPDHQQLQIYREGNLITQTPLEPRKFSGRSDVLDFLCDRAECDAWQKGFYTFEATVNGDYLSQPSVEFKGRRKLKLLAIPVKAMVDGKPEMPDSVWLNYVDDLILKTFPISSDGLSVIPESKRPIDATDLDLSSPLGRIRLAARVATYQPFMCGLPFRPACYDLVTAIIPRGSTGSTRIEGWAGIPGANSVIVMAGEGLDMRVAHEAGHVIGAIAFRPGLGDEYDKSGWNCGTFRCTANPPPRGYSGYDGDWVVRGFLCPVIPFHCSDPDVQEWRPGSGFGSAVLADRDGPFDVTGSGAQDDKLSFMGSAGAGADSYWISPDAYDFLFTNLAPTSVTSAAALQTSERVATVSGWITDQGYATFLPIYHFLTSPPPSGTGAYTVEVRSAQGSILASQSFDLSFVMLSNPPELLSEAFFRVEVVLPTGSKSIRLVNEGRALAERQISAHAPSLVVTSPTGGQTWAATGNYTIRWQGSDRDGDTLHYTVLYRQGTGDWSVLGTDLTTNELTVDAAGLPGGNAAQVQVLATDGINTTTAESGRFTVGRKGPEAFITYPAEGASFMPGVSLFLQGTAYDLEDGTLPDPAYRWRSDRDGNLGTGSSNLVILSPGPHVITLTVTDSDGNTAVKTIRLSAGSQQFMPLILRSQ